MSLRYEQGPITFPDLPDRRMQVRAAIPLKSRFCLLTKRYLICDLIVPHMGLVVEIVSFSESCGALRERREVVDLSDDLEGLALVAVVHNG